MAKQIDHISGKVKLRSPSQLDSDRFTYLSLDQAEPNFGRPDSDGALVVSNVDGTRRFTTDPRLSGLSFKVDALDSADESSFYALFIKGSPLDGSDDSIGFRRLDGTVFETDTLDTVATRGNVTDRPIQVAALTVDSAGIINGTFTVNDTTTLNAATTINGAAQVNGRLTADSALISGRLIVNGDLQINGTTTTVNSTELSVNDKNIVLADSAPNAAAADSAGITIAGANAHFYYKAASDTWNLNKAVVLDSSLTVGDRLFIQNVRTNRTNLSLFIDETTGEVFASTADSEGAVIADQILGASTNADSEFYPLFSSVASGIDSVNADTDLSYNPNLNRLSLGRLRLNQLQNTPLEGLFLTIDSNNDIGFREIVADSEADTLQSVTTRGDSTNTSITVKKLTTTDSVSVGSTLQFSNQFLDGSSRRLVIYDSAGAVLWG